MKREIKIFKTFEEQEKYFLSYFFSLTPAERLNALAELQKKNFPAFSKPGQKKITVHKQFIYGH